MRRAAPGVLAALALIGPAQAQVGPPVSRSLAFGEIRNLLPADTRVGSRRAGLICAPAGPLRWRDVEPRSDATRIAVTGALRASGLAVDGPSDDWLDDRASTSGFRLVAAVAGLEMRVCTPGVGAMRVLDHSRRLKGDGVMLVEWRIYRLADRAMVATTRTCASFGVDAPGLALTDAATAGLIENARLISRELARVSPSFALPPRMGRAAERCPLG